MTIWYAILVTVALGLLAMLWRLVHQQPRLEVGERGILDRRLGCGWIPWDEIEGAYPPTGKQNDTVRLKLKVTERLARILGKRPGGKLEASPDGSVEVQVDLAGTDLNAVDLLRYIMSREQDSHESSTPSA